ncbi:MAG: prepilin-type N-terminal cleavage/methylation domain-containing protein [Candidatus Taylorbacteria bacterium]|nr:prepilin-type N-terminal cleavage/methylation domain-containing protein [Candidatus Taylorbacteria bacterium]
MEYNRFSKGFTLIELLVVIAIIGILSSVVLASLGTARSRSKATSVKATLNSLRSQLEINSDGTGYGATTNYAIGKGDTTGCANGAFAATSVTPIRTGLTNNLSAATDYICSFDVSSATSPATKWAVAAVLPDGSGTVCVDSSGNNKVWPSITSAASITTSQINNGVCI